MKWHFRPGTACCCPAPDLPEHLKPYVEPCCVRPSFVGGLSGLHTYFTSINSTTYEHFRSRKSAADNPYDLGCAGNWRQVSARPNEHFNLEITCNDMQDFR